MSVRVGNTLISPLVNNGGGSILTITITPQQGGYDSFTWSGATTQQIADAFAAGTTIKLNYGSDGVYDVDQLRTFTSGANINVIATYLADYDTTIETQLFYDGTGEQFDTDFYTDSQVDNLLAGKQDTLTAGTNVQISSGNVISATNTTYTAGTGISISNNVISATGTGSTPLILTITPDQQTEGNFTWTGATIEEIHTTSDSGAEVLISKDGDFYKVVAASYGPNNAVAYLTVVVSVIHTLALRLYPNGQGESLEITLVYSETLAAALATKQNTLTAGTGISITNGVISCTFANGNGVSY